MRWIALKIVASVFVHIKNQVDRHRNGPLWVETEPAEKDTTDLE
jgi:hypothetical protein